MAHDRKHDVDSGDEHNGVTGVSENDLIAFDSNGLPKGSGKTISDILANHNDLSNINGPSPYYHVADLTPQRRINIPLDAWNGTATLGDVSSVRVLGFDDTTDEYALTNIRVPKDWDGANDISLFVYFAPYEAQTSGDRVKFVLDCEMMGSGEDFTNPTHTQNDSDIVTVSNTAKIRTYATLTMITANIAAFDVLALKLSRDTSVASNRNGDADVIATELSYESKELSG